MTENPMELNRSRVCQMNPTGHSSIPEERQVLEPSGDVNMEIPAKNKTFSLVLKGLVALSAAVGVFLSALASKDAFMGGSRVFMYFTIQSNIVIAILLLLGAV